ncbi:guided entry of tail-anchored proteins factor CAMLG-like isoform X2 [Myxocyprinus asiaticus]|uniref:guided entry of tail-anchored proteins factor CAMLG-like isoform X2 n=1 Tax=Myxocyprinus asiaticus TaxID=70543 RepID=UPI002222C2A6|nr:guided entry of tail-anchored proteins factor CAMLG-like isoform X2 [Myxocyprinus asiaticus]
MESNEESPSARTAAQRRAEIRRRKLLMNSEDRINKIVGFSKADADGSSRSVIEPRFHLDLVRNEPWSSSASSKRLSPHVTETAVNSSETSERNGSSDAVGEDDVSPLRPRPHGELLGDELTRSPRRGLHKYLSRFDDAMKLRGHLAIEKAAQESSVESEEFDSFCLFRLLGSVALAIFVRIFVCQYLSIFAPFLTLELGFMGLNKYFPKMNVVPSGVWKLLPRMNQTCGGPQSFSEVLADFFRFFNDVKQRDTEFEGREENTDDDVDRRSAAIWHSC